MDGDRSWVVPGAEVVLVSAGSIWGARIEGEDTVARVGARDVVLAGGRRFRLSNLTEQGRAYGATLHRPGDRVVSDVRAEEAAREAVRRAQDAVKAWNSSRTDANALAAIEALQATVTGEDEG